jgi:hypothetical protein
MTHLGQCAPPMLRLRTCIGLVLVCLLGACAQGPRAVSGPAAAPAPVAPAPAVPAQASPASPGPVLTAVGTPATRPATPAALDHPLAEGFDLAAYRADPAAYCRATDGSRCNQVAQPGPRTPALASVGAGAFQVRTGGSVELKAQTDPGMPVSFTSQGLGLFPASGLSAVTVQADADGLATATFQVSPGTVGHCLVIAGSPSRAGTIQFLVTIQE